jgi:hypothetical protein
MWLPFGTRRRTHVPVFVPATACTCLSPMWMRHYVCHVLHSNAFLPSRNYAGLSRLWISSECANFLHVQSDFKWEIVHSKATFTPRNETKDKALINILMMPCVVSTALLMKIKVFCHMTLYQLVTSSRRFSPLFLDSYEDIGGSCLRNVVNSLLIDMWQCHRIL